MSEVKYKAVKADNCNSCKGCIASDNFTLCDHLNNINGCDGIIYQLDIPKMTLEQAREKFESKYGHLAETMEKEETGEYIDKDFQFTWIGYKWGLKDFNILEEGE